MLGGLIDLGLLLAILVGLVLIHELGHFIVARRANVRVHEFGVGFPPRAGILHRGKETIYSINWLPIGGFVRLEGEQGESVDPRAFVNKRLRTRLAILLAGVAMNFLLAWLIFSLIAALADPVSMIRVGHVQPDSPAERAGLLGGKRVGGTDEAPVYDASGELIAAIDGLRFPVFDKVDAATLPPLQYLRDHAGQEVALTIRMADGSEVVRRTTLRTLEEQDPPTGPPRGALGVTLALEREDVQHDPLEAVVIGFQRTVDASTLILRGVVEFVTNLANPPVSGPLGIAQVVGQVRESLPPVFLVWLVALLSANLAVVNLLPFPPMDGGRIAMALVQAVSGNRVSPQAERLVYMMGFVVLMALLLWVTLFDLQRASGGA